MIAGLFMSAIFICSGAAAYSGLWKGWLRIRRGYGATVGFSWLWIGLGLSVGVIGMQCASQLRLLFIVAGALAAILLVIGAVGMFWLPRFLLPRWYRVLSADFESPTAGSER